METLVLDPGPGKISGGGMVTHPALLPGESPWDRVYGAVHRVEESRDHRSVCMHNSV